MNTRKKILVVDDNNSIRTAIADLLSKKYLCSSAENFDHAVEFLEKEHFDLIITDIRMPGKSGLDLIEYTKSKTLDTQYALITAYDINDYIHFAKDKGIWNIIPKYSSLDLNYITVMVDKLLYKDIFGPEKYFPGLKIIDSEKDSPFRPVQENCLIYRTVRSDEDRNRLCEKVGKFMGEFGASGSIHQILEELTSNAMIRAPKDSKGNPKYQYELPSKDILIAVENVRLNESDFFELGYGMHKGRFIIVTRDFFGSLRKEEIIKRLDRHIYVDPSKGFPEGLTDSHGRGLFICREMTNHIIFNIKKDIRTEVIAVIETAGRQNYKSLSIFEID